MDVRLPNLGEGADSGTVVAIHVKEGDTLTKGQTMLELENEKAVASIPSPAAGKVTKLSVKVGDKISVGHVVLSVEGGASDPAPAAAAPKASGKAAPKKAAKAAPEPEAEEETEEVEEESSEEDAESSSAKAGFPPPASPSLRRLAQDLGIDLQKIKGSEEGGRIVISDLAAYIKRLRQQAARGTVSKPGAPAAPAAPEPVDYSRWGQIAKRPMTSLRQTISRRMVENWTTIPHVTQFDEADITNLLEIRKRYVAAYEAKGAKLTLTSFALKIVAQVLKKHPLFNSTIDEVANEVITKEYYHIGLAVDTEAGLIVPVIRDVDKKNLVDISKDVTTVAEKARDRKITMDDIKGGTFTISNQGGIGGAHFTPIVNKPEVAILGLGKGALKAVVKDKQIVQRLMLPICVSYDHRIIDGGNAARFTTDLVAAFENFKEDDVKI